MVAQQVIFALLATVVAGRLHAPSNATQTESKVDIQADKVDAMIKQLNLGQEEHLVDSSQEKKTPKAVAKMESKETEPTESKVDIEADGADDDIKRAQEDSDVEFAREAQEEKAKQEKKAAKVTHALVAAHATVTNVHGSKAMPALLSAVLKGARELNATAHAKVDKVHKDELVHELMSDQKAAAGLAAVASEHSA